MSGRQCQGRGHCSDCEGAREGGGRGKLTSDPGEDVVCLFTQKAVPQDDGIVPRLRRVDQVGHWIDCPPFDEWKGMARRGRGGVFCDCRGVLIGNPQVSNRDLTCFVVGDSLKRDSRRCGNEGAGGRGSRFVWRRVIWMGKWIIRMGIRRRTDRNGLIRRTDGGWRPDELMIWNWRWRRPRPRSVGSAMRL